MKAKEARKIADLSTKALFNNELDKIIKAIADRASIGGSHIFRADIEKATLKELESLGYKVEYVYNSYLIKW